MHADEFVPDAFREAGFDHLSEWVSCNRSGDPTFHWRAMHQHFDRYPTPAEADVICQAFDLWFQLHPVDDPDKCWDKRGARDKMREMFGHG